MCTPLLLLAHLFDFRALSNVLFMFRQNVSVSMCRMRYILMQQSEVWTSFICCGCLLVTLLAFMMSYIIALDDKNNSNSNNKNLIISQIQLGWFIWVLSLFVRLPSWPLIYWRRPDLKAIIPDVCLFAGIPPGCVEGLCFWDFVLPLHSKEEVCSPVIPRTVKSSKAGYLSVGSIFVSECI